jgi:peroxiredoxin
MRNPIAYQHGGIVNTLSGPLGVDEYLPTLDLVSPTGRRTTWVQERPDASSILYFMRTSTCPLCHQHLRALGTTAIDGAPAAGRAIVVVPGGATEAAAVERRHPLLAGRVFASDNAHVSMGLFVTMGMQRSGTYVADADGRIVYSKTATVPMGTFNERETVAALD